MNLLKKITEVTNTLKEIETSKPSLSFQLYNLKKDVYWKDTPYDTWVNFCNTAVNLSQSSVFMYVRTAKTATEAGMSLKDVKVISADIGWERTKVGFTKLIKGEKPTVEQFIERFKNINLNERVRDDKEDSELTAFTFHLKTEDAANLTNELIAHGMRVTNRSRTNASSAMSKIVSNFI